MTSRCGWAGAVLLACTFSLCIFDIQSYDVWWHLATGKYVMQTGSVPHGDPFSYTAPHQWVAHEWLCGVLYYGIYRAFGLSGLVVANAFFITLALGLMLAVARGGTCAAIAPVFLTALAARDSGRIFIRPDVFSLLFVAVDICLVTAWRNGRPRLIWACLPVQVLWCNVHGGGCILGILVVGSAVVGEVLRRRRPRDLIGVSIGVAALSFLNPYGWHVPFYFLHAFGSQFGDILEWRRTEFSDLVGPVGLVLGLAACTLVSYWRALPTGDIVLCIALGALGLRNVRFIPLALLGALTVAPYGLGRMLGAVKCRIPAPRVVLLAAVVACTVLQIASDDNRYDSSFRFGMGVNEKFFPTKAVEFLKDHGVRGPMFNCYGFGGYLIWAFYPDERVFIDGRADVFGEDFIARYRRFGNKQTWSDLMRQYHFSFTLLDNEPTYIAANLDADTEWALVYWDDRSLLYLHDTPQNHRLIGRYRYVYLHPNNRDFSYLDPLLKSPSKRDAVMRELDRAVAAGVINARLMRAYAEETMGAHSRALADYQKVLDVMPQRAFVWRQIGIVLLSMKRLQEARASLEKAVELDPADFEAQERLGVTCYLQGDKYGALRACQESLTIQPQNATARKNLDTFSHR